MRHSLSVRARLFAVALLGAGGTATVASVAYVSLSRSIAATHELTHASLMQRQQMEADMMHDAIRADVYSASLSVTNADVARARTAVHDLADHIDMFNSNVQAVADSSRSEAVQARVREMRPELTRYTAAASAITGAIAQGTPVPATDLQAFEKQFSTLEEQMEKFGDLISNETQAASATAARQFEMAKLFIAVSALVIILVALLASLAVQRYVTRGLVAVGERARTLRSACITSLNEAITAMARGDLTVPVRATTEPLAITSDDEIAALSHDINEIIAMSHSTIGAFNDARTSVSRLVTETQQLSESAQQGRLEVRGDEDTFDGSFRDVVRGVNQTLDAVIAPINEATVALERLAARDLTARVTGDFHGDHAKIQRAFNSALDNLAGAMKAVSESASGVSAGAIRIDEGSRSLAQSATDQAASLEEISASAREMASMTKRNAESASEGRALADSAQRSTADGVAEVQKLVAAMDRMKASAEATAKIVRTIDEIAFQTNLLALNAAVEAARAGESGRGFAVVAEEVRALALRSAEAARSTSSLIDESVSSTALGVSINERVLTQLGDVQNRVLRVGQVVAEIAVASEEQARGVAMIDTALEDMAQRTVEVAASADLSKEASEALSAQSEAMHDLVSSFELDARRTAARSQGGAGSTVRIGRGRPARATAHAAESVEDAELEPLAS